MYRRNFLRMVGIGTVASVLPACGVTVPVIKSSGPEMVAGGLDMPGSLDTLTEIANALAIDGEFQQALTRCLPNGWNS
jgi:hypothetical protein